MHLTAQQTGKRNLMNGTLKTGTGYLYDPKAKKWFIKLAELLEIKANEIIGREGEPKDWSEHYIEKTGHLGLTIGAHTSRRSGQLVFRFHLHINKLKYKQWAKDHLYLMESLLTFRLGPVIFAHPGRDTVTITRAGKQRQKPINIWELTCGFMTRDGVDYFDLLNNTITVEVRRNELADEEETSAWIVKRIK